MDFSPVTEGSRCSVDLRQACAANHVSADLEGGVIRPLLFYPVEVAYLSVVHFPNIDKIRCVEDCMPIP
jgi:hypothetical protein